MERYLTSRYAAVSWAEAVRLAKLDLTELGKIHYTPDVELIHRTDWWAWWSDQRLTPAIGLPEELRPQGLSVDAEDLITDVWASGLVPTCGWTMLAKVQQVIEVTKLNWSGSDQYSSSCERLKVEFRNGSRAVLYRHWHGGDYLCEIRFHQPGAV
ncbi:MAG: hypothetical protein AAF215_28070 [Cyanobacteria bacterium P01_A01_bin.123]